MTTIIVVPHTHWDREWYLTESQYRQRLIPLLDDVLARLAADAALTFHLDGQLAIVDDYLAVRPDARPLLARFAESGRLSLGPWYVLADELLAGGEPLVRNLLLGRRRAAELGGWLAVGYSPDAFGHPAMLPAILRGFGIGTALLWRGYGGEPGQEGDLFRWTAADGSTVRVHHLPPDGYEYGANLPADSAAAATRWAALEAVLGPRAVGPARLVMNGADHHALQPDLPEAVAALRRAARGGRVEIGTLDRYFEAVAGAQGPEVQGELRWSYRYTWTLQGVHATRATLKRRIAQGATLLTRWAEPQAALATLRDGRDRRPLLEAAWREHLLNLSHDVLGGCVADPVADDAALRARHVIEQARGVMRESLGARLGQDPTVARRERERWRPTLVLVNPSPTPRAGVIETTVTLFVRDVVVGRPDAAGGQPPRTPPAFQLVAPDGSSVAHQVLGATLAHERLDTPRDYPDQDLVWAVRVAVRAPRLPAFGLLRATVREGGAPPPASGRPAAREPFVTAESARFALREAPPRLESARDLGDTYTFQPASGDRPIVAPAGRPRVIWGGPLVAAVGYPFRLGRRARGTVFVRVDAGSSLVRYVIEGVNLQGDHRLRLVIPAGRAAGAIADMAFGPTERAHRPVNEADYPREWPVRTGPMHRYVRAGGRIVYARGLHEYELLPDGGIAVTLLRAVGQLSRGDLPARPGHAGWPTPTPGAEELGPFRAELAVAPDPGGTGPAAWAAVERGAEELHAPLAGWMLRWAVDPPDLAAGPELTGDGLAFSALKPREDAPGVVLRAVNLTSDIREGVWRFPAPVSRAFRARLDETVLAPLALTDDRRTMHFQAAPREIVTVIVEG